MKKMHHVFVSSLQFFNEQPKKEILPLKTLYYPTDAQIYNSWIQLELL